MIVTKKAIPRRTVLRGLGATLALPLLDSMVPAFTSLRAAASPVRRLGVGWKRAKDWITSPDPLYQQKKSGGTG